MRRRSRIEEVGDCSTITNSANADAVGDKALVRLEDAAVDIACQVREEAASALNHRVQIGRILVEIVSHDVQPGRSLEWLARRLRVPKQKLIDLIALAEAFKAERDKPLLSYSEFPGLSVTPAMIELSYLAGDPPAKIVE
jgi:hypothetical protein